MAAHSLAQLSCAKHPQDTTGTNALAGRRCLERSGGAVGKSLAAHSALLCPSVCGGGTTSALDVIVVAAIRGARVPLMFLRGAGWSWPAWKGHCPSGGFCGDRGSLQPACATPPAQGPHQRVGTGAQAAPQAAGSHTTPPRRCWSCRLLAPLAQLEVAPRAGPALGWAQGASLGELGGTGSLTAAFQSCPHPPWSFIPIPSLSLSPSLFPPPRSLHPCSIPEVSLSLLLFPGLSILVPSLRSLHPCFYSQLSPSLFSSLGSLHSCSLSPPLIPNCEFSLTSSHPCGPSIPAHILQVLLPPLLQSLAPLHTSPHPSGSAHLCQGSQCSPGWWVL